MSLLTVVRDVCPVVGVAQPTSVAASIGTNRTMQEMLACANESAQSVAYDNREWTQLKTRATFTGNGVADAFNLPANYKRMLLKSNVWRSTQTMAPMRFVPDLDEWMQRRSQGYSDNYGEWTIYGGQMHIQPILAGPVTSPGPLPSLWLNDHDYVAGETAYDAMTANAWVTLLPHTSMAPLATFADDRAANPLNWAAYPPAPPVETGPAQSVNFVYLDKNCISLASGGYGDKFQNDADSFRLDERLLKLYMIWKWKSQKGTAYAEDMSTYADALNSAAGADQPAPILIGRSIAMRGATVAYPWPVPT